MDNQTQLDNQLADLTDALLERGTFEPAEDMDEFAQIVQQLHTLIEPDEKPPPIFRARLTETLTDEWNRQHRQKKTGGRIVPFRNLRLNPYLAAAAVIVVVFLVALLLTQGEPNPQTGTAADADGDATTTTDLLYIAFGAGAALMVGYLYVRFRNK